MFNNLNCELGLDNFFVNNDRNALSQFMVIFTHSPVTNNMLVSNQSNPIRNALKRSHHLAYHINFSRAIQIDYYENVITESALCMTKN